MKGNAKVIAKMNDLLSDELTAVSQYMVHSEMCANWGFTKLADAIEKRAIDEMKHAEMHIGRILFLEGIPIVSHLKEICIGAEVEPHLARRFGREPFLLLKRPPGYSGFRDVVRHVVCERVAPGHGSRAAAFEIFLPGFPGLPEMHVHVYEARKRHQA